MDNFDLEKHVDDYLNSQHCNLWGKFFAIKDGDHDQAREFIIDLLIDLEMVELKEEE